MSCRQPFRLFFHPKADPSRFGLSCSCHLRSRRVGFGLSFRLSGLVGPRSLPGSLEGEGTEEGEEVARRRDEQWAATVGAIETFASQRWK